MRSEKREKLTGNRVVWLRVSLMAARLPLELTPIWARSSTEFGGRQISSFSSLSVNNLLRLSWPEPETDAICSSASKGTRNLKQSRSASVTLELTDVYCWWVPRREIRSDGSALGVPGLREQAGRESEREKRNNNRSERDDIAIEIRKLEDHSDTIYSNLFIELTMPCQKK